MLGVGFEVLLAALDHRVAPFDTSATMHTGGWVGERRRRGRPVDLRDSMIAGIALSHRATLVTRNLRHFDDPALAVVNPWTAA